MSLHELGHFIKSMVVHMRLCLFPCSVCLHGNRTDIWLILSENILSVFFKRMCLFQKDVGCVAYSSHRIERSGVMMPLG